VRNIVCSASQRRLIVLFAVALLGGIVAALHAAEEGSPTANAPAGGASRANTAQESRANEQKAKTGNSGRIDGYLAGGRWREGSKLVDVAGQFKTSGERVAFHAADGKAPFPCLENLNSERVARIVAESPPESLEWIVQGTLTEFRNENYLLITQAVITNRAIRGPRPSTERRIPDAKESPAQP